MGMRFDVDAIQNLRIVHALAAVSENPRQRPVHLKRIIDFASHLPASWRNHKPA
jgi:hypothetical protein